MLDRNGSLVVSLTSLTSLTSLAWLTLAGLGAGCGAGSAGGGTGGSDGSGGVACVPTVVDDNTVATFEDGFGSVLQRGTPPRNGGFYAYNDGLTTCMETPAAGTPMPAATAIEGGGRCGSAYAFRFSGGGCSFAGAGTDLAAPLPPDGGDADADADAATGGDAGAMAQKIPYDLSGYKQVTFWGRTGAGAQPASQMVQFKLPMLVDTKVEDGGTCVQMQTSMCSASYGKFLTFTRDWQLYTVDLIPRPAGMCSGATTGICQETWGRSFTWDATNVVSMQFQAAPSATFDIWIDDISLVPR
jgi:hypothetical protein